MITQLRRGRPAASDAADAGRPHKPEPPSWSDRRAGLARHLLLAVLVYVPLLLTEPGRVAADTKTYLYLDPARLLGRAASMWDENIGLGTVTHQNIGYLWPMGPWYWFWEQVGAPDWVAQRLWLATTMFAAGAGVLFLLRSLRWRGGGMVAAAALYMLSPYVLHYGARISVLLLPWAGLPWLVGLTQRAVRTGSWRHPAIFALVVATVGGVNATALVMAGIGPLLWLPFAVLVHREATWGDALRATLRIGLLTTLCSLWWVAGLAVQGGYGIDILRYTETIETVARTSLASEVLRGLGYWFFYGGDLLGPWIEPGRLYTQFLPLILIGFAVPIVAFAATVSVRWRYRGYFVCLVLVGTAAAVGAFPYDDPSPLGAAFKELATGSTVGLALRSTPRAVPLVVLGLAVLAGSGISALSARTTTVARIGTVAVVALAIVNLPPLWRGDMIGANLQRPEDVPSYWHEATSWLDERGDDSRVLEIPGSDFAAYRWGNTVDPVTPGLMDRPMVARELIPYGSPPSADLLIALDRRMQEGVLDPAALAPMARILGAGDILLRSDLQYERYRTPKPRDLYTHLTSPVPEGLGEPVGFGEPEPNIATRRRPVIDEIELDVPPGAPHPPPVAVFPVEDAEPIVRVEPTRRPVIMAGDGEGVVEAAAAGLLDEPGVLLYDADLDEAPEVRAEALDDGARLVLTDSNRRRQRRWSTVRENAGVTEAPGEVPLRPVPDQRLPLFSSEDDDARTVVDQRGVARVQATSYGNHISYSTDDRPANAIDGDVRTAWTTGAFGDVIGERLLVELDEPVTTDRVRVTQPLLGDPNRWVTAVEVILDGESIGTFDLSGTSRLRGGEEVVFGERTFTTLELEIADDNVSGAYTDGLSSAGFAEVELPGVELDEVIELPNSLLGELGEASADHELTVLLARNRTDPRELYRTDEEHGMVRSFELPTARRFRLGGQARLNARATESSLDEQLLDDGTASARASRRIVGDVTARAANAFDGDPGTAWRTPIDDYEGQWLQVRNESPMTVERLDLEVVTDGRHSVPTSLGIVADGERIGSVDVPAVDDLDDEGATTSVSVEVPRFTARTVRLVVEDARENLANDAFSTDDLALPVGIAEVSIPADVGTPVAEVDTGCRTDLLTVDDEPVGIRITGDAEAARRRQALSLTPCGPSADGIDLGPGEHVVRTAEGRVSGIDLDRLVLTSPPTGDAAAPADAGPAPTLEVVGDGRTSFDLEVTDATEPFWLVLGQSHNEGWQLSSPQLGDVGPQRIVDGYANGWLIDPGDDTELTLALDWTPQRMVWGGLALSALGAVLCLALAVVGVRRARPRSEWMGRGLLEPLLVSPVEGAGVRPPARTIVGLTAALGLTAGLVADPWVGVVVAAASAAAFLWRPARALLTVGSLVFLGGAGLTVVYRQFRYDYRPDFGWPEHFWPAHVFAWLAILLLVADVVVGWARRRTEVL